MQQNSSEWHAWRLNGLGGSDAPILMGFYEYSTPYKLWQEKTGLIKPDISGNFITDLGHKFEKVSRAQIELENDIDLKPTLVEMDKYPFIRASLDGYDEKNNIFAEFKYMGKENFEWVKKNKKPLDKHHPQVQQQFLVTGCKSGYYVAYTLTDDKKDIDEIITIDVKPDLDYIKD